MKSRIMHGRKNRYTENFGGWKRILSVGYSRSLHDKVLVPTLLYGCDLNFFSPDRLEIRTVNLENLCSIDGIKIHKE